MRPIYAASVPGARFLRARPVVVYHFGADRLLVRLGYRLWLLGLQILMFFIYILFKNQVPTHAVSLRQQIWSLAVADRLLCAGDRTLLPQQLRRHRRHCPPWDTLTMAVIALAVYYWGAYTCLRPILSAMKKNEPGEDIKMTSTHVLSLEQAYQLALRALRSNGFNQACRGGGTKCHPG